MTIVGKKHGMYELIPLIKLPIDILPHPNPYTAATTSDVSTHSDVSVGIDVVTPGPAKGNNGTISQYPHQRPKEIM